MMPLASTGTLLLIGHRLLLNQHGWTGLVVSFNAHLAILAAQGLNVKSNRLSP